MKTAIVSDNSSLIMLGKLQRVDLLTHLFESISIPARVAKEIKAKEDDVAKQILDHPSFKVEASSKLKLLSFLDGTLDYGEPKAIALARENGIILLVDEKKARKVAKNMGLKIIGLLGILLLNKRHQHITREDALNLLEQIKQMDFRLSVKLESDLISRL